MKILVLGATGGTGRQVVFQALDQGHNVTVLVRDSSRLTTGPERLHVHTGSVPDDSHALLAATVGQDAVIRTLGVGNPLKSPGLIARSVPAILRVMEACEVRRVIFMSAYGVGATLRDVALLPRSLMRVLLADLYADKAAGEDVLRRSGLDWTLVYPVTLTNGPRLGRFRVGERLALRGLPRISRGDVAEFLLEQIGDTRFVKKGVLISN